MTLDLTSIQTALETGNCKKNALQSSAQAFLGTALLKGKQQF